MAPNKAFILITSVLIIKKITLSLVILTSTHGQIMSEIGIIKSLTFVISLSLIGCANHAI